MVEVRSTDPERSLTFKEGGFYVQLLFDEDLNLLSQSLTEIHGCQLRKWNWNGKGELRYADESEAVSYTHLRAHET